MLSAENFSRALTSQPAAAAAFGQLRRKAAGAGKLRVMVWLRVPFAAEGQLAAPETTRQRSEIAGTRTRLMERLEQECARRGVPVPVLPATKPQSTAGALRRQARLAALPRKRDLGRKPDVPLD